MKEVLMVLAGAVVGAGIGASATYFVTSESNSPKPAVATEDQDEDTPANGAAMGDSGDADDVELSDIKRFLKDAEAKVAELEKDKDELLEQNTQLDGKHSELKREVDRLHDALDAATSGEPEDTTTIPVNFGKWNEVEGLRKADWKNLGETYTEMHKLLKQVAEDRLAGREPDQDMQRKIGKLNEVLQNHLFTFFNDLPTHSRGNGGFTHPANMVNILSGQLEAAGMPLTTTQISELTALGERYDTKWDDLQDSYGEDTYELQKIVDEAELKEWYRDEMFKVTSQQQKNTAVPPEIEGLLGFDLYSSGLILAQHLQPEQLTNVADLSARLKAHVTNLGVDPTTLDSAEYIFDDWIGALNKLLEPQTAIEATTFRSKEVIAAAKAQLAAMKTMTDAFITDEEVKQSFRAVQTIVFPQIVVED